MDETARSPERDAYILSTDRQELRRLGYQHLAWASDTYALWEAAGLRAGDAVVDLGCGPGDATLELARLVGPAGRVVARDRSAHFLDTLRADCARLGWTHVEPSLGDVESFTQPSSSVDAIYARWLLCWLADPSRVFSFAGEVLRPGGVLVLQEYLDWATLRLLPRHPAVDRAVDACMRSWPLGGATIDVAERIPELAALAGLQLVSFRPVARTGRPGSLVWGWITGFFASYLPRLVERGLLSASDSEAALAALDEAARDEHALLVAPLMADVVLRRR